MTTILAEIRCDLFFFFSFFNMMSANRTKAIENLFEYFWCDEDFSHHLTLRTIEVQWQNWKTFQYFDSLLFICLHKSYFCVSCDWIDPLSSSNRDYICFLLMKRWHVDDNDNNDTYLNWCDVKIRMFFRDILIRYSSRLFNVFFWSLGIRLDE